MDTGMGIQPTMPMMPANNATNGNAWGNGADGGFIWILMLILLLGGAGGLGLGNRDAVVANATDSINSEFLYTQQKIDNLRQDLVGQTNQLNQSLNAGINSITTGICGLGHQLDLGFCGVNRNIDASTCAITTAIHDEGRLTRDLINANTMQDLRDRNAELAGALSNSNQTAAIIQQLRPYPTPSYAVAAPGVPFGYAPCYDHHC